MAEKKWRIKCDSSSEMLSMPPFLWKGGNASKRSQIIVHQHFQVMVQISSPYFFFPQPVECSKLHFFFHLNTFNEICLHVPAQRCSKVKGRRRRIEITGRMQSNWRCSSVDSTSHHSSFSLFFPFQGVYILQPRLLHGEGVIIHSNVYFNKLQGLPPRIMSKTKERRSFLLWRNALKWFYLELTQILSLDAWLYISIKSCLPFGLMERHSRRGFRVGQFQGAIRGSKKEKQTIKEEDSTFLDISSHDWENTHKLDSNYNNEEIVWHWNSFTGISLRSSEWRQKKIGQEIKKITSVWFEFRVRKSDFPQKKEN